MIARRPAVAGSFYPAQSHRLRQQVEELLAAGRRAPKVSPKALIVPHAGYVYSGRTAAAGFATLFDSTQFARIVLVGPAHYVAIRGVALPTADAFETPLGRMPLDQATLNEITDLPFVSRNDSAHAPERALEVELPFLQIVLPAFSLLPLVIGDATAHEAAQCWRSCGAARKHCSSSAPTCLTTIVMRLHGAWMQRPPRPSKMAIGAVWAQSKRVATCRSLAFLSKRTAAT